jgi:quercetin dioxygenase-like cupin family protein
MARYVRVNDQSWEAADVVGVQMQRCLLWEGQHNVFAGFFRMPQGMQLPTHRHAHWVQILVMRGTMRVDDAHGNAHVIAAGGYYFVEPGDTHVETALEDTLVLVVAEEDRDALRHRSGGP